MSASVSFRLRRIARRWRRETAGVTAIEFAILGPVFFMFAFGIVQFGFAFYEGATIQWAVERAVRTAMVQDNVTADDIEDLVDDKLENIGKPDIDLTYDVDDSGDVALAHVTASFDVPVDVPFIDGITIPFSVDSYIPVFVDP